MALVDNTSIWRSGLAASAAALIFTVLAVASTVPAWAAQPTASAAESAVASGASADGKMTTSRKNKNDIGLRGHGFVAEDGVFTTIDAPGAGLYTGVFGIDDRGRTVGGYVDD